MKGRLWLDNLGGEREDCIAKDEHTHTHTYILPCVKQIASGKLLYSTGSSAQCSVMTRRGGIEGGREG